ncbi:MAG TPA: CHAD domain-containing protein [Gemmatimonadales bacterium]|nr:CHAD domain-containing protein [Gemmatimonadales bacterium]
MRLPDSLLELTADEAARLIALQLLETLRVARERLGSEDPEALHDFRVALRRLRTALRTYRPQLRDSVGRRPRRRLRRIASSTRESRDLEVHLAWTRAQRPRLTPRQQLGVDWLIERMERRRGEADAALAERVERGFDGTIGPLERRLRRYRATVALDPERHANTAAAVLGARIQQLAGDLEVDLGNVHGIRDEVPAHRARIAAKRLRYALEPIAGRVGGVEPAIERLRGLQDELGDLHDSHVFVGELVAAVEEAALRQSRQVTDSMRDWQAEPAPPVEADDPRPGLLALARCLRERGRAAFDAVATGWLNGAAEAFFHELADLGRRLVPRGGGLREIERKFLLRELPPAVREVAPAEIRQGYLPGVRLVERLREVKHNGSAAWFRTVKSGTGVARLEVEEETSRELFDEIWPLTAGRRVVKRRYRVPGGALTWEIDEFVDRDLVLAEVELPAAETVVKPPAWLAPYLVRDVTEESEFSNVRLAR